MNDVPLPLVRLNWRGYALAGYSNSYPLEGYTVRWVKSGELELKLSSAATVNLALYSLDGRLMQKFVLGKLEAGRYRLIPKGELNRGVYIGRLAINKNVVTVKLVRH